MQGNQNPYIDPMSGVQGMMDQTLDMRAEMMPQQTQNDSMSMMPTEIDLQMVYPEVFYKLQPYILMVCDQLETYGYTMPTQQIAQQMTDYIYDDVMRMYPEIGEYVKDYEQETEPVAEVFNQFPGGYSRGYFGRSQPFFGRGFRRRGLFRDLIDILILSELFNRRRRYYDFY